MSAAPTAPQPKNEFAALIRKAEKACSPDERNALARQAYEVARAEHHQSIPLPAEPLAQLYADCQFHLRFLEVLRINPGFAPSSAASAPVHKFWPRMRSLA